MTKISNPQLRKLDENVGSFYSLSARYVNSLANLYGKQVYKENLDNLLQQSHKIEPESRFDELVLKNIKSNLILNDMVVDYLTDPGYSMCVKDFFNKLTGEGMFDYLEQKVRFPSWEKKWEYSKKREERDYARLNPFTDEAQKSAREWLPKIKNDVTEFGKKEGFLPEDFNMDILLLPPKEGTEWSSWNSKTGVFSLGSYGFEFFSKNGKVVAKPTRAYNIAFHEILGHGAHQIHSENMPCSLKFTEEIGFITPTKSITEGVAINAEKKCSEFLKQRLDELDLNEEDIVLLEEGNDLEHQSRIEMVYFSLTKDREVIEEGFNGYEHLLELTQNPVLARTFRDDFSGSFRNAWKMLGHSLGPLHYQKMLEKSKPESTNNKEFHKATLKGVWSSEVYPEAVAYLAKQTHK